MMHLMTRAGINSDGGVRTFGMQFPYCARCGWIDESGGLEWMEQECSSNKTRKTAANRGEPLRTGTKPGN